MTKQTLREEIVALTCDLVAIPSVDVEPDQLQAVIDYTERYARAIPGVFIHRFESNGKPSLTVTLQDTHSPALMLNGHLDVVPARDEQYQPQLRDGRIYGRGSQDMKGSCAVMLRLMKDLAALPNPPDVGFQFVSDEEIGGIYGTGALAEQGWSCGFFIAAEPTDLQICFAHKGAMWVEIEVPGKPSHGSRPWEGENAFAALREGLAAMEQRYPTPDEAAWVTTVVPTVVHGGSAGNRLPESILLSLDIRHVPDEAPEQIVAALQECYPQAKVSYSRGGPPLDTDPNAAEVRRLAAATEAVIGKETFLYREHFASDARFYSSMGIPAVCFGPVGAGLHSDEEWVDVESLVHLYEIFYLFSTGA